MKKTLQKLIASSLLLVVSVSIFGADPVRKAWELSPIAGLRYSQNASGTPTAPTIGSATVNSSSAVTVPISTACVCDTLTPQYKTSAGSTWTSNSTISTSATSYQFTGLSASTAYDFRFVAGANSQTANSSTVSATTSAATPTAPTLASPSMGSTTASITFSGGANYTTLIPQYSTDNSTWSSLSSDTSSPLSYTGLTESTLYYFRALADNNASYASNTVSGTTSASGGSSVSISGGTLTVTGTGFGTKSRAAPVWFDDFADATVGQRLAHLTRAPIIDNASGSSYWATDSSPTPVNEPIFSNTSPRVTGKPFVRHDMTDGSTYYNKSITFSHLMTTSQQAVYTSFWWRTEIISGSPGQTKPLIIYGNRSGGVPEFYLGFGPVPTDEYLRTSFQDISGGTVNTNVADNQYGPTTWTSVQAEWIKIELILVQSTASTNDGEYYLSIYRPSTGQRHNTRWNNTGSLSNNRPITRLDNTYGWRDFSYGASIANGVVTNDTDEVYMDDSADHRRLVLTNNSTYLSATLMENQLATAWSDTSITATFRQGAFASGATVHAFIVTGAGGYNSYGSATYAGSTTVP